ncbi:putative protein BASIC PENTACYSTEINE4-like [Capsicum annuum]|nr:putative protein BASIC PENTACYSTEINE4-like [Capsicum annuum]
MELGLVTLLRAAWVAAILPIVFALIPSSKLSFFQQFVLGFAKRGKIMQASSNVILDEIKSVDVSLGTLSGALRHVYRVARWLRIPKSKCFRMEAALIVRVLIGGPYLQQRNLIILAKKSLVLISYFRLLTLKFASFSVLYADVLPEVYKFGLSLIQEFIVKGKDRMLVAEVDWWRFLNPLMQLRWYSWMGAAIFCWGWIHQCHCHAILVSGMCYWL